MARLLFDGMILHDGNLQHVRSIKSEEHSEKWDAVSIINGINTVLKTFDTEQEAKDFINGISDEMIANEDAFSDVIDVR